MEFDEKFKDAALFFLLFLTHVMFPSVPPHTPSCEIPSGAVTGSVVQLRCRDRQSIPPATYSWFKDDQLISAPRNANATYLINSHTGILVSVCVCPQIRKTVSVLGDYDDSVKFCPRCFLLCKCSKDTEQMLQFKAQSS